MHDDLIDTKAKSLVQKVVQRVREGGLPSQGLGKGREPLQLPGYRGYQPRKKVVQNGRPTYGNAPKSFKPSPQPFKPV